VLTPGEKIRQQDGAGSGPHAMGWRGKHFNESISSFTQILVVCGGDFSKAPPPTKVLPAARARKGASKAPKANKDLHRVI
jgi:hypothetical protein